MKFLIDAQLPPVLAHFICSCGHDADHIDDIGMQGASDRDIWDLAERSKAVIISKDEDFVTLRTLHPDGPALVWIRTGNVRKKQLLEHMEKLLPQIIEQLENDEKLVEVL